MSFYSLVAHSNELLAKLKGSLDTQEVILDALPSIKHLVETLPHVTLLLASFPVHKRVCFKSFVALAPDLALFHSTDKALWDCFIDYLYQIDSFYRPIGGLVGYYSLVLTLLIKQKETIHPYASNVKVHYPPSLNLTLERELAHQAVSEGIHALRSVAFMAPVGGAGERLDLHDPETKEPLPAATLPFLGRSLLEDLVRFIHALELLYFKSTGDIIHIPIAFMTSTEKDNDHRIKEICKNHAWFGRSPDSFRFFSQPQVPLIDEEGHWAIEGPLRLMTRPGGHGALWRLAEESGTLEWLQAKGKTHLLIRQINNPLAATDDTVLALIGYGFSNRKAFGFVGCNQVPNAHEGVDLLLEKCKGSTSAFHITNVEYSDFMKWGFSPFEADETSFPANTNILFAAIEAVREAVQRMPIPSPLVNFKTKVQVGKDSRTVLAGRLESTMQNLADAFEDTFPFDHPLPAREKLRTYLIYNQRQKTISVTKRQWKGGEDSILETPEGTFFDLLTNNYQLLQECSVRLPEFNSVTHYLKNGPNIQFLFHPALGPLYAAIKQKIRGGNLENNSEMILELSDFDCENLSLKGSLIIEDRALKIGGNRLAKCVFKNVRIENAGIDYTKSHAFWKGEIERKECLRIILHENSELYVQDAVMSGNQTIEVFPGQCLKIGTISR